jgi:acetyl-CoA C-acetyltransferase
VVIAAGARTPIGKVNGAWAKVDAVELGAHAVRAALSRTELEPVGNVLQAADGQNPGRRAALLRGAGARSRGTRSTTCVWRR